MWNNWLSRCVLLTRELKTREIIAAYCAQLQGTEEVTELIM